MTLVESLRNAGRMTQPDKSTAPWLIADIGATNSRCAVFRPEDGGLEHIDFFRNADFTSIKDMLQRYLTALPGQPKSAALAVAAPISGYDVRMINRDWQFNRRDLAAEIGFEEFVVINDFHAIAYALPALEASSKSEIGSASAYRGGNLAVLGPGSGLGMAAWIVDGERGVAMSGEGGHVTLAARDEPEERIVRHYRSRYGHSSAERLLSGPGLPELHQAMHGSTVENPESITQNFDDARCVATFDQFCKFLGSVAADLALVTGATGGLYIAGGIVPACLEQFRESPFRERFEDKNRYRDYMRAIPTYVITAPTPALTGLGALIRSSLARV